MNRREFITQTAFTTAGIVVGSHVLARANPTGLRIACAAITWNGNDLQAMADMASLGYRGIQLRANTFAPYKADPSKLKALLSQHKLALAMFSSGDVATDPASEKTAIAQHVAHARFAKALGGSAIQLTNNARPKDRLPTTDELKRLTTVMNAIGQQTADLGVQATYHNHMHQLGETPDEVDVIVQAMNPKYVRLLLDIAHYQQGGGKPERAVKQYKDILHALHLKDTKSPLANRPNDPRAYQFVELGRGNVDLPAVFNALEANQFKGWGVVELDAVPDAGRTPLQCAATSKAYLTNTLHFAW